MSTPTASASNPRYIGQNGHSRSCTATGSSASGSPRAARRMARRVGRIRPSLPPPPLSPTPLSPSPPPTGRGERGLPIEGIKLFFSLLSPEGRAEGRERRAGDVRGLILAPPPAPAPARAPSPPPGRPPRRWARGPRGAAGAA